LTAVPPGLMLSIRTTSAGKTRTGVNVALDLESYDFRPGSHSLIRASEETILERLPPRIRIRTGAPLEVPHVLVLIDDREVPAIAPLAEHARPEYETRLMLNGGRVAGAWVAEQQLDDFASRLEQILERSPADNRFLFAVGDGNHSLATAKAVWEKIKDTAGPDHPGRYALAELVSLYDPGLHFEPIHRIVRCSAPDRWVRTMLTELGGDFVETPRSELLPAVGRSERSVGIATSARCGILTPESTETLPVALVQEYLNQDNSALEIDYIHGSTTALDHSRDPSVVSLILPDFDQSLLFPTIASDGVLPRKAFSLGEAADKRYYLEARRISG